MSCEFVSEWIDEAFTDNMNLREKTVREKPRERELTIMSGDYNEFNKVLLRLQVIGFFGIRSEQLEFRVISCSPKI